MNKKIMALICMVLIVTTPLTLAQFSETSLSPQSALYGTYGKQDLGEAIIVNVKGYEPAPIASASIESGVTPVFVYLQGTTFGTTASMITGKPHKDLITGITNIPPIKSMIIQPDKKSLEYLISPPKYIKPKKNAFSLNNLGQVILSLKQIPKEEDVPNVINLNFTATINFDLEQGSIFGISQENLVVKQHREEETWLQLPDSQKDRFFADRGYIRMTFAERNKARFIIYDKNLNLLNIAENAIIPQYSTTDLSKESTLPLKVGETSDPIVIGSTGDLFLDSFRVRLNQVIEPQDKAYIRLTVYGNTYDKVLIKGKELYPGSRWKVTKIYIEEQDEKKSMLHTDPKEFLRTLKERLGYTITLEDLNLPENIPSIYTTTHVLELENSNGERAVIKTIFAAQDKDGDQNILNQISNPIDDSLADSIILRYCPAALTKTEPLFTAEEPSQTKLQQSFFVCKAVDDYKKILNEYPSKSQADDAAFNLGEIFFRMLIPYTEDSKYFPDMKKLALHFYRKVSEDGEHIITAQERIDALTTTIGGSFFLPDEAVGVDLKRVRLLTAEDKPGAEIIIDSTNPLLQPQPYIEGQTLKYEKTNENVVGKDKTGERFEWFVEGISSNSVIIKKRYSDGRLGASRTIALGQETALVIKEGQTSEQDETIHIKVTTIDSNVEADITILPGIGEAFSTSSFQVHLPIDKRPFKFSKEQIEHQIRETQKLIEKLDKNIEKLDKLVKSLKKTCLVVATALIVKNSFFTGAKRNIARKEVMKVYDERCKNEIAQGINRDEFHSQDGCYQHYSDEIDDALDEGEDAVEEALDEYKKKIEKDEEGNYKDKEFNNYMMAGGTPDDYKKHLIYKELNKTSLSGDKNFRVAKELIDSQIAYDIKINRIETAQKLIEGREFKDEAEKQKYLQFLIHGLENPDFGKAPEVSGTGTSSEGPKLISNLISTKQNEFDAIISYPDKGPDTFSLTRPPQFALNIRNNPEYNNDYDTYKMALIDKKREELKTLEKYKELSDNAASLRATEIINNQLEEERLPAVNKFGQPIFIDKDSYDQKTDRITKDTMYYTSNLAAFVEGQSIRNEYIEQTSYRTGGKIEAQFTTDGYVYCYPTGNGEYALANNWFKTGLPDLSSTYIYNVGPNGRMECGKGDDVLITTPHALSADKTQYKSVSSTLNRVSQCKKLGDKVGTLKGTSMPITCSFDQAKLNEAGTKIRCTDTMDPSECKLLFNICDPVMCPASRCDLGGRWQVDDVIGSGLIGSAVLCWPNRKEGIYIPVCLTGISAGLRNIKTILQGYQSCLETSLKEGRNVGLCDYIRSVGICEVVWKEALFIVGAKGGILDWAISKASPNRGGEEYTRFQQSFDQASKSFNYFTTEYSQSLLAQYKGKSFQEVGTEVCKLAINGKLPNIGDIVDELSQPEDPPQFTAVFDETPAVTQAGINQFTRESEGLSYYRGFYHIYAGKGYEGAQLAPTGYRDFVQYSVYLRSTTEQLPILFVTKAGAGRGLTSTIQSQVVRSSVIKRGEFVQESINVYGESGYDQICVVINGKTSCGFGKASSAYSLNALQDYLVVNEAERGIDGEPITTAEQCRPDYPRTSPSLGSLKMPQQFGMLNTGIVRICNPTPPGSEEKWRPVGDCGKDKNGKYLGKCWLDIGSISINDAKKRGILATEIEEKVREIKEIEGIIVPVEESRFALARLDQQRMDQIDDLTDQYDILKREKPFEEEPEPKEGKKPDEKPSVTPGLEPGEEPGEEEPGLQRFTDRPQGPPVLGNIPNIEDRPEAGKKGISGGCRYDGLFRYDDISVAKGNPKELAQELKRMDVKGVYVYAFASEEGTEEYNQKLSDNRVNRIKDLLQLNGLNVINAVGKGETARFDLSDKELNDEELAKKEISENRRFVISTEPITNFLPAPLAGTTANCEILKESRKPIPAEEPVSVGEYEALVNANKITITGRIDRDRYYTIRINDKAYYADSPKKISQWATPGVSLSENQITIPKPDEEIISIEVFAYDDSLRENSRGSFKPIITGNVIAVTSLATKKVSQEFKDKVLKIAKEYHDRFNALKTEKSGEVKGEYTYEHLIKFSADPEVAAEALLHRANFYKELAEFVDELIGEKPEIPLRPTPIEIKSQFTAETTDRIEITGNFDFTNYDYFITITDVNNKKAFIRAENKNEEDLIYRDNSITLTDKYDSLKGNINLIQITVYMKGTSDYPLTSIQLTKENNFGKGKPKEKVEKTEEETIDTAPDNKWRDLPYLDTKEGLDFKGMAEIPDTGYFVLVVKGDSKCGKEIGCNYKLEDVDPNCQAMYIFKEKKLIRGPMPVSTGANTGPKTCLGDQKTPEGRFKINSKNSQYTPTYKLAFFMGIDYPNEYYPKDANCKNKGGQIGFHTLPGFEYNKDYNTGEPITPRPGGFDKKTYNKAESKIGKRASAGCIRMCPQDIDFFFNEIPSDEVIVSIVRTADLSVRDEKIKSTQFDSSKDYYTIFFDQQQFELRIITADKLFGTSSAYFKDYVKNLKSAGAIAVFNAGFMSTKDSYKTSSPENIVIENNILKDNKKGSNNHNGLLVINGNNLELREIDHTNQLFSKKEGTKITDIQYAIQGPRYIMNGNPITTTDDSEHIRNSLSFNCNDDNFIITQSRNKITTAQLKNKIKNDYDCKFAIGLDGGGSTSLYYDGRTYESTERSIPNVLAVFPKKTAQTGTGFSFVVLSDIHEDEEGDLNEIIKSIKQFKPKYIIINGDLIMKGGKYCKGENLDPNDCYKKYRKKLFELASELGAEIRFVPGNHDHKQYNDVDKMGLPDKKDLFTDTGFIFLDYLETSENKNYLNKLNLNKYENIFIFSHLPFMKGDYRHPNDITSLPPEFLSKLESLSGKCALIGGHQHVYEAREDHPSGCLSIIDGVAGGDHSKRTDNSGELQDYASFTLIQIYTKGFKVCAIKKENDFKFEEAECTYRNK